MILSNHKVPVCVKRFVVHLIDFCLKYFQTLPIRQKTDYTPIKDEEVQSECFSLFKLKKRGPNMKQIRKEVKRIKMLGMDCALNYFQNTHVLHLDFS